MSAPATPTDAGRDSFEAEDSRLLRPMQERFLGGWAGHAGTAVFSWRKQSRGASPATVAPRFGCPIARPLQTMCISGPTKFISTGAAMTGVAGASIATAVVSIVGVTGVSIVIGFS